ncbi:3-hydroxyacyl-CoA dehydrogenase NAD-binding domain-containing protein [Thalassospira sp.]|uniref:3-hydroxyacyl-CoA dehydrogenase NAD-binding domain-containing protein n=1 Tax=Thalassospira sp. TaxID=1912094 RepID=UPI002732F439|nr:3-hydroxyacyl-CoA dehydrogenase NAD-binding domain-containing protein [Thalassospira sp.]MDP2698289.1 3-hydroxyacyl-CoA dehydrogenase NAD-binding domain-containing protein [Thalassospira sp.]
MSPVSTLIENDIAIITIDHPPINATNYAVRRGIWDAIDQIERDDALRATILICAGSTFIAGADVTEFGKPPMDPILPDLIVKLEQSTKPLIAAIHGNALGAGLEVALGCHYRIATVTAKLGLPEVNLGLIPGAGGTVRLPRLIAVENTIAMITGGKPVNAVTAHDFGLIDAITDGDLRAAALALAERIKNEPCPTALIDRAPVNAPAMDVWDAIIAGIGKKARGQDAPVIAAQTIRAAVTKNAKTALGLERENFVRLRDSRQSKALRHIFFAERSVAKLPELAGVGPRPVREIGVIGGGIMGAGIATAALLAGYAVVMIERDADACERGVGNVRHHLDGSLKRGIIDQPRHDQLLGDLVSSTDYAALADCDLVIEAVFEDMGVKHDVFARLSAHCKSDAVLASNTSYLDINAIAERCAHPDRVIGLHFFSPAHVMKLLEVVRTRSASPVTLATAFAFARRLGKIAVPCGVCDGFIGNRIMSAYRKHCEFMLEDGAMPHEIDAAMVDFGFPMGLFAMQDMAGLEISWATRKRQALTRDPAARYVAIGDILCEMGRFGRKTGAGWYHYSDTSSKGETDPMVENIIIAESTRKGITRQSFDADTIMARILAAIQDEGDRILAEGIAATPEAIDVVMVNGYGFPRWRGGPMFMRASP